MNSFIYRGAKTKEISFPLGGIGSGSIGLAGNGRLIDWEIFNRPNKGGSNGFSFFSIKAETGGQVLDARILNSDLNPPYMGSHRTKKYSGYGFGPLESSMAGIPHFKELEFQGEFPMAQISFIDNHFPGAVTMSAFNPFIPLNDRDSSIPAAFFEFEIENTNDKNMTYTLCAALQNPHGTGNTVNRFFKADAANVIKLSSTDYVKSDPRFGDIAIATDEPEISFQEYWYRGRWFDSLSVFWSDFTASGKLKNRSYDIPAAKEIYDVAAMAAHIHLQPKEKKSVRFVISWNYPNCYNYWNAEPCDRGDNNPYNISTKTWKNYYATIFEDSSASALYALTNFNRLYSETLDFKNALFTSTLPMALIDAISANISILKTPTCLRLEDGSFYAFEGCFCDEGCCEGSCTHVWNYAYALPFLFPKLERSMRDLDYKYNMDENGGMQFRLQLPLGRARWSFRPCADGQLGGVIKTYRDWKISGDTRWLQSNWDKVKKSLEFAWSEKSSEKWDYDKDGVLEGRQHHTLDMELFGPNSWLSGFYLAALKAGSEMAIFLGERPLSLEYSSLYEKGKAWIDANLFNGEYYHQFIDLRDKSIIEKYDGGPCVTGDSTLNSYWSQEHGEIKYQMGEGCHTDQIVAQWHANICGLGEIFDKQKARKALQSIFRYNFKDHMRNHVNPCRLYALNGEAGTVICSWPEGKYKPAVPAPYSEEVWSGCEYQIAAHMIQEGMVEEGCKIVRAVRSRYDGEKRNPWNEIECGSNYARSMASYSLLNAWSGFEFNMVQGLIGFCPVTGSNAFKCFWSLDSGWGTFDINEHQISLSVHHGKLYIKFVKLPFMNLEDIAFIHLGDMRIEYQVNNGVIVFNDFIEINLSNPLLIHIKPKENSIGAR